MRVKECFKPSFILGLISGKYPTRAQRKHVSNTVPAWFPGFVPTKKKKRRRR